MTVPIKIPDLGAAADDVTLVRWLVKEGDEIVRGQKIAEVETDKALVALESVATGVLLKRIVPEGQDAMTGDIIAYIGSPADSVPEAVKVPLDASSKQAASRPVPVRETSKSRVTPMLRNFAKQKGVDVDTVVGTGRGGMVTRQDIIAAAKQPDADR